MGVDARASVANPPVSELRQTADYLGSLRRHFSSTWVLVVGDALRYGLARMMAVFLESHGVDLRVYHLRQGRGDAAHRNMSGRRMALISAE